MSTTALAECIRLAANIHESSYDQKAANQHAGPGGFLAHPEAYYGKTLQQSCIEAEQAYDTHKGYGEVAFMMLKNCWNQALDWANKVLDTTQTSQNA